MADLLGYPLYVPVDGVYTAQNLRQPFASMTHEGVVGLNDMLVVPKGGSVANPDAGGGARDRSVDVLTGSAWVKGDDSADQGYYFHRMQETVVNVPLAANATGGNRKDAVVLRVYDSPDNQTTLEAVTGPTGGGNPTIPSTGLLLAYVTVANADTQIVASEVSDQRTYHRAHVYFVASTGGPTITTTMSDIVTATFTLDSDALIRCRAQVGFANSGGTGNRVIARLRKTSGTAATIRPGAWAQMAASGSPADNWHYSMQGSTRLLAGTHTVALQAMKDTSSGTITASSSQNSENPTWLEVEVA